MEDAGYKNWVAKYGIVETPDYDYRAAFAAGLTPDARGHMPDTYKKTNHITYSAESLAAKEKGAPEPGRWDGDDKLGWTFFASPTNIQNAGGVDKIQKYFTNKEPGVKLVLPYAIGGVVVEDSNKAKRRRLI